MERDDLLIPPSWTDLARIARPFLPDFGLPPRQTAVLLPVAERMTDAMFAELRAQASVRDAMLAAQWAGL